MSRQVESESSIVQRLDQLETSLHRWKVMSACFLVLASLAILVGADSAPNTKFGMIEANSVAANKFYLIDQGDQFGTISVHTNSDGKRSGVMNLKCGKNVFYATIEDDNAKFGLDCASKPVFDVRATDKATWLNVSGPNGNAGLLLGGSGSGGALLVARGKKIADIAKDAKYDLELPVK